MSFSPFPLTRKVLTLTSSLSPVLQSARVWLCCGGPWQWAASLQGGHWTSVLLEEHMGNGWVRVGLTHFSTWQWLQAPGAKWIHQGNLLVCGGAARINLVYKQSLLHVLSSWVLSRLLNTQGLLQSKLWKQKEAAKGLVKILFFFFFV